MTGANGFLGKAIVRRAAAGGHRVRAIVRAGTVAGASETLEVGDPVSSGRDPARAMFDGVDAVIHLAARVHVLKETAADPAAAFMQANRDLTLRLAEAAAAAGVARFVQASSVAAVASLTPPDKWRTTTRRHCRRTTMAAASWPPTSRWRTDRSAR